MGCGRSEMTIVRVRTSIELVSPSYIAPRTRLNFPATEYIRVKLSNEVHNTVDELKLRLDNNWPDAV